jgi:excisionase family DNA binding protein
VKQQDMPVGFPDLLSARQVAELTGVPVATLHMWAAQRERGFNAPGPAVYQLSGRHRRWARSDVLAWLASTRIA